MATVDAELLRQATQSAAQLKIVSETSVRPAGQTDAAIWTLDEAYYPDLVQDAYVVVKAYVGGSFNITYREDWGGDSEWRCRWDRHENPHNARDHFHEPPSAETVRDREYPANFFDVLPIVFDGIERRLGEVWDDTP